MDTGYSFGWGKIGTKNDQTGEELSGTTCQSSKLVFFFFPVEDKFSKRSNLNIKNMAHNITPKCIKPKLTEFKREIDKSTIIKTPKSTRTTITKELN